MTIRETAEIETTLQALLGEAAEILPLRNKASGLVRDYLAVISATAEAELIKTGNGTRCAVCLSGKEDQIIRALFVLACDVYHVTPEKTDRKSVV